VPELACSGGNFVERCGCRWWGCSFTALSKYSTELHTKSVASSYLLGFPVDGTYVCSLPAIWTPKQEKYPYFLLGVSNK